jgi:signal transduction histidine kinase
MTAAGKIFGPSRGWRLSSALAPATALLGDPAKAQSLPNLDALNDALGTVTWVAVTAGTALAAIAAFALFLRNRRDDKVEKLQAENAALRSRLDRTEALLGADDQRTIIWDTAVSAPQIFGGLPERVEAPADKAAFLAFGSWLSPASAGELESAADKLRREGIGFQMALRANSGAIIEATGRTSGRRSLVRLRELTGERRSFAELKEQAIYVVNEMSALRALADVLPFPLWRRNRTGRLTWVNAAYVQAVEAENADAVLSSGIELLPSRARETIRETQRSGGSYRDAATAIVAGDRRRLEVIDTPIEEGSIGAAIDISELEAARAELKRLAAANARTLDQLTAGVAAFDQSGILLFHNEAFRKLFDLAPGWLASGPEESAILDQLRADRKLPEQANYRDWRAKHLAAYRGSESREEWWHLPDGRSLRMVAMPNAEGGMTYIYENVTEQLQLESRLKAMLQLQGETLAHLVEAVAVFGTDGKLRLFNPVFANIWRLSPVRLRAEPHITELIADCQGIYSGNGDWEEIRLAVTDLEHGKQTAGRMQRPDGSVIDYASVALPEGMTMLTFVDVTDTARIQRVLSERNEALEAAGRLKSDFIQHVSYELRSPLQTIIGFSELLSVETAGALNPQQREYMDHIDSSSRSLLALIDDILDLATVDAGIMSLNIEETDIADVAHSSVEGLRDRLAEQNIELDVAIPRRIGTFHVDAQRVRQILFNLVSNAIRFSNAGGHIRLSAERRGGNVIFTVADDGVGIPDNVMPSIYQRFEAHDVRGRRSGAGLGLSIVRSLVELHGGEIDIRSEEGRGTIAVVTLPAFPAAAAAAAE